MYVGARKSNGVGEAFLTSDTTVYQDEFVLPDPRKNMSVSPKRGEFGPETRGKNLNVNRYATKKTIAQGMLDVALLTANASQLKYVLTVGKSHEFYSIMLGLIITSLIMQVTVGVLFLVIGGIDLNSPDNETAADILNNIILIIVFITSIINVVINGFGIEQSNRLPPGTATPLLK